MKLSRLEVFGFKSFAKKLDLALTGGITAVVGPNGCGKTNVVDAIRWVLGEQKPSQIRLERMEDVLFKGSTTRSRLGMSEVSLTIENVSGILPVDMPEVTVTRRLFRSGESDYMINRKSCRLADINDLLMDTGMGTDSYSVFEQSMINAILSDKTDDRRHIFEEAAGVTKYKARRKSALNKLASIESDLERVGDIVAELQRRVDSLRRQAARARRYRKLKSELKEKTVLLASYELARHRKTIDEVTRELDTLRTSSEGLRVGVSRGTAELETLAASLVDVEKDLTETARRFSESMGSITGREKDLARLDSRLESLDEIVNRARETSHRNALSLEALAESHGDCAGNLVDMIQHLDEVERSFVEARKRYEALRDDVSRKTGQYETLEKDFYQREREIAARKASLATIAVRREADERRLGEIAERLADLEKTLVETDSEQHEQEDRKLAALNELNGHTQKVAEARTSLDECAEELAVVDASLRNALERQASLKAERDFLAEIVRSFEGYSEGVKNAVRSDSLSGRVLGVLGDLISTDELYVPAVEAAIREGLQTVLVETADDALAGARYLSGGDRGRASFMPLDDITDGEGSFAVPDAPGVHGLLADTVKTEERFIPVVKRLFRGIVIVDTLDTALDLYRGNPGAQTRYVTLSGDMVGMYGEVHGGSVRDAAESSIGRKEKLDGITAALERVNDDVAAHHEHRNDLSERAAVLRGLIAEMEKNLDVARNRHAQLASAEARTAATREALLETVGSLKAEDERIRASFTDRENESRNMAADIESREKGVCSLSVDVSEAAAELDELRIELERRRTAAAALEVERAALTEKKAALTRELESIGDRREALAQASNRTLEEVREAENEILSLGDAKKNMLEELESLETGHERLKNDKDAIERRYSELRAERSEKERSLQNLRRELDEITRRESALVLKRDETLMITDNIGNRLAEDFFIDTDDIPEAPEDRDFDPANEKLVLEDLRRRIHMIGDVNLAAERDYEDEKKRLDFLVSERDDLVGASTTLTETITKINTIARSRFVDTYEQIRLNFQKMFNEFFEGGICDLTLEEGVDPLEANILISARPPGKNVRSINLLSSGERALTAISLLFAIYLVKPSPFCILDEVDAPLDDANIDRYLAVIRRFSERTQFIMVTHNKKTMAAADNLYGITMEEPGLSTLVSVRLNETADGRKDTEPVTA